MISRGGPIASQRRVEPFWHVTCHFDIGADTVGMLVPGGSIAVKVARVAIDRSY